MGVGASGAFAEILEGCRPLFPPALVASGGWERLVDLARRLPRSAADANFGFEFRLGESAAEADLFIVVMPRTELSRRFVREGARAAPGSPAAALAAALRELEESPESRLARSVAGAILEYDLAGHPPRRPPPPGVFLAPRAAPGSPPGAAAHRDPAALAAALAAAAGWSAREFLPQVERVFAALPEAGFVFQAGVLPARFPRALRLVLKGFAGDEIPGLLERLEWPGPAAAAADALAALDGLIAYAAVGVDVAAGGVGPRLGLEFYRGPLWAAVDRAGWRPVIARLEERGWCLPEKADGLRRWPGVERLFERGEARLVRQGINHVKLAIGPGARIAAKAYAGMDARAFAPRRRPPGP